MGRRSKELITAGKPEESELYKRLTLPADDKKRMPKGGEPLAKDKIDLIGRWIKEGAVLPRRRGGCCTSAGTGEAGRCGGSAEEGRAEEAG